MNILNENEAIVINSLENWEKVAGVLRNKGVKWSSQASVKNDDFDDEYTFPLYIGYNNGIYWLMYKSFHEGKILIQDTEFIAKHSDKDKTMKIVVKKENGLLEVGQTYEADFDTIVKRWYITDVCLTREKFDSWLSNGYIEEVKEVSYRFEDMVAENPEYKRNNLPSTNKQYEQIKAFAYLTHVRAKILKDHGYSEDWEPAEGETYTIVTARQGVLVKATTSNVSTDGLELRFPNTALADLAKKDNKELFKTYLGV